MAGWPTLASKGATFSAASPDLRNNLEERQQMRAETRNEITGPECSLCNPFISQAPWEFSSANKSTPC